MLFQSFRSIFRFLCSLLFSFFLSSLNSSLILDSGACSFFVSVLANNFPSVYLVLFPLASSHFFVFNLFFTSSLFCTYYSILSFPFLRSLIIFLTFRFVFLPYFQRKISSLLPPFQSSSSSTCSSCLCLYHSLREIVALKS
jgi:hypothetical protein